MKQRDLLGKVSSEEKDVVMSAPSKDAREEVQSTCRDDLSSANNVESKVLTFGFDQGIDLSPILKELLEFCISNNLDCPWIILGQDLPDKDPFWVQVDDKQKVVMAIFDKHRSKKGILKDIKNLLLDRNHTHSDIVSHGKAMIDRNLVYGFAWDICDLLHIPCPTILESSIVKASGNLGQSLSPGALGWYGHDENVILLNSEALSDSEAVELVYTLAHELRHCWQNQPCNRNQFSFHNYKKMDTFGTQKEGMDSNEYQQMYLNYALQEVEIDANAFAQKYLDTVFSTTHMFIKPNPIVQEEIEKRKTAIGSISTRFKDAYDMWNRKQVGYICRDAGLSI